MSRVVLRNLVFTLNNYTNENETFIQRWIQINARYGIYGREIAPTTGTKHLQGYMEMGKTVRFSKLIKELPKGIHIEQRKGSAEQAAEYCKKDGDFWEWGTKGVETQGKRTDLDRVRQVAIEKGLRDVTCFASHQEIKVAESFLVWNEPGRDWKPTVLWFYGATGLGKSRRARWILQHEYGHPVSDIYTKSDGSKWWPGYDAHGAVIIDDFRPSWWPITEMLSLLDRYEKRVEFKGGYRQFRPRTIVVTSCLAPKECYESTGEAVQQLVRRIDLTDRFIFEWLPPEEVKPPCGDLQSTPPQSPELPVIDLSKDYTETDYFSHCLNLDHCIQEMEKMDELQKTQLWECPY